MEERVEFDEAERYDPQNEQNSTDEIHWMQFLRFDKGGNRAERLVINNRSLIQLINILTLFDCRSGWSVVGILEQVVTLGEWLQDKDDESSPLMEVVEDCADKVVGEASHVICAKDPIHEHNSFDTVVP